MYDAAVIGGGLAGCSAAIRLAEQGYNVVLFEANTYPHHKVCGEFLSPGCTHLLDDLRVLDTLNKAGAVRLDSAVITTQDGHQWITSMPGALGISRYALDAALKDRAESQGVRLHQQTTVTDIKGTLGEGFTVSARSRTSIQDVKARVVIGAHGKSSRVDRILKRSFLTTTHGFIGLKNHFAGVEMPRRVELYTFPGGYCGMSEVENGWTNVCLLARQSVFRSTGAQIAAFIEWIQLQNPGLRVRLASAQPIHENWLTIAQVPFARKSPAEQDILMVGDASGMIAPVTGDGMEIALQTGMLASTCTAAFLDGVLTTDELVRHYSHTWRQAFGFRLRMGHMLQAIMLRPRWIMPGIRLLNRVPALGQYLVNSTRSGEGGNKHDVYSGRSHRRTG